MATTQDATSAARAAAENQLVDTVLSLGRLYQQGKIVRYEVYVEAIEAFTKWCVAQEGLRA